MLNMFSVIGKVINKKEDSGLVKIRLTETTESGDAIVLYFICPSSIFNYIDEGDMVAVKGKFTNATFNLKADRVVIISKGGKKE